MVYFVKARGADALKIGYTEDKNFGLRMSALQTGNHEPLDLLHAIQKGDVALERRLHTRFHKSRLCGEWFRYSGEIEVFLAQVSGTDLDSDVTVSSPVGYARLTLSRYQKGSIRKVSRKTGFAWEFRFYVIDGEKRKLKVQTFNSLQYPTERSVRLAVAPHLSRITAHTVIDRRTK